VGRLEAAGVEVWVCRRDRRGQVDLGDLMTRLAKAEVLWVLAEGGGDLSWSLLRDGLASELNLLVAPLVIGGVASPTVADGEGIARLKDALRVSELRCRKVGEDLLLTGSLGPDVHRDR
jgi:diaminohydroxyphosphoribosylaminopyrimidine deaminase/5-amino-6-(5-phosphoribosylamino)uracil reductase